MRWRGVAGHGPTVAVNACRALPVVRSRQRRGGTAACAEQPRLAAGKGKPHRQTLWAMTGQTLCKPNCSGSNDRLTHWIEVGAHIGFQPQMRLMEQQRLQLLD